MSMHEELLAGGSGSFWEVESYKRTVKRHEDGYKLCDSVMNLIKERADLEKAYAKSLKEWAKKWSEQIDKGELYWGGGHALLGWSEKIYKGEHY